MKTIKLSHITKIEGHARLKIVIDKDDVEQIDFEIVEGARYFEGLLLNRDYFEVSDVVSRICGFCSCTHNLTAISAIENIMGVEVSEQTKILRELLQIGGIIQSHILHLYFLALPDYLGYDSAIAMASKHREEIERALKLKSLANKIVFYTGGREVHPITTRIGGFSKLPTKEKLNELLLDLKNAKTDFIKTAELFAQLNYSKFERKTDYLSLKNAKYEVTEGKIGFFSGKDFERYDDFVNQYLDEQAIDKFVVKGDNYMTGALARMNNNFETLSNDAKSIIKSSSIRFPNFSPFANNFAQSIELVNFCDTAIKILEELDLKEEKIIEQSVKSGMALGVSEAPRGILFHKYKLNEKGEVTNAEIITPTAQNLKNIEGDIKAYLPTILDKPKEEIVLEIEKLIRAYDPCISCNTHFLKVDWIEKK